MWWSPCWISAYSYIVKHGMMLNKGSCLRKWPIYKQSPRVERTVMDIYMIEKLRH